MRQSDQVNEEIFSNGKFSGKEDCGNISSAGDTIENDDTVYPEQTPETQTRYFDILKQEDEQESFHREYKNPEHAGAFRQQDGFGTKPNRLRYPDSARNGTYGGGVNHNDDRRLQTVFLVLAVCSITALLIAFLAVLFSFVKVTTLQLEKGYGAASQGAASGKAADKNTDLNKNANAGMEEGITQDDYEASGDYSQDYDGGTGGSYGDYYGELSDAIREDLPYTIEWDNFEYDEDSGRVTIDVQYPIIGGDIPNVDVINAEIMKEKKYFEDLYTEYSIYMLEGEQFQASVEGYITYMDEETLSVVFAETVNTDYWSEYSLHCINVDASNGVVLDNQSIIDVNADFATDFRIKSREQNGEDSMLYYMTEQEIMYYLTDPSTIIVFYTPAGMEIGMNFGEGFLTVTYNDYEYLLKKY